MSTLSIEHEDGDPVDETESTTQSTTPARARRGRPASERASGPTSNAASESRARKMLARRAVGVYASLADLDHADLRVVGALAGVAVDDLVALAVEISTASGLPTTSATTLVELAGSEQMEAVVEATMLADSDPAAFRALFALANAVGLEVASSAPRGPSVKAALVLVQSLSGLGPEQSGRLERAAALLS